MTYINVALRQEADLFFRDTETDLLPSSLHNRIFIQYRLAGVPMPAREEQAAAANAASQSQP
jgi:hypothetical protein